MSRHQACWRPFGKDITVYQDAITSNLGRWVTNNVERVNPESAEYLRAFFFEEADITEEYPWLCKYMGRSLDEFMVTRFAAAMAVVGIVLSALGLASLPHP